MSQGKKAWDPENGVVVFVEKNAVFLLRSVMNMARRGRYINILKIKNTLSLREMKLKVFG